MFDLGTQGLVVISVDALIVSGRGVCPESEGLSEVVCSRNRETHSRK